MNKNLIVKIANDLLNERVLTLAELFSNPFLKRAISLGELYQNTNNKSIKYESGCTATMKRAMPKQGRWTFSVKCSESWSKGPYDVRFKLLEESVKTRGLLGREIETSCNCNAWRYNGADYNSLKKDYNERQYSNGQAPTVRDKKHKFLICKHVAACVPIIKDFVIPKGFK